MAYPKRSYMPEQQDKPVSLPLGGLIITGVILGALAAGGWQIWLFVAPMLENPAPPNFEAAVAPPALPTPQLLTPTPVSANSEGDGDAEIESGERGQVIEPIGLAIRSEPNPDSTYLGGIVMGETVVVLDLSSDGNWQRVRRELNGQEGWVKAGNLGSTDAPPPTAVDPAPNTPAPQSVATPPQPPPAPPPAATQNASSPDDTDVSTASAFVPAGERGRVLVPVGLAIRSQPDLDASRVGGVPVNEVITVLQVTPDGRWQRIRRQNGQEGWVKAGNLGPE